ncbi:zinc finger protein ZAT11-like [Pistacia vera]|uniref:zinc finger protein ZAT11-like n=1 Tax=Pistacia vera TaxID=55513 RepID=UPI00126300BF|nr:zinc finger protein ZAT11-like [Pistacia vera]XP_031273540.1 zinc finger protein ZAT11-like [Pistacia vera]
MKRVRENGQIVEQLAMANCLMLLSHSIETKQKKLSAMEVYECKTCNRQFPSFQALGGHRASHKRPRLTGGDKVDGEKKPLSSKPKLHECSICGQEFAIGQALGGHMRRHRAAAMGESLSSDTMVSKLPMLVRSNSRRIFGLDLNLTPLENDLEFLFGKRAPKIDLSI